MDRTTSTSLGGHFDAFIAARVADGRYRDANDVIRAGLRLLEAHENRVYSLRRALLEGEVSGAAGPLEFGAVKTTARRRAGLAPDA